MKNIILKSRALVLLVFALVFFSCQDDELIKKPNQSLKNQNLVARTASDPPYKEGASIILGENKRNPYTVQNMTTAWQYLLKTGLRPNAPASIRTTHLYIKFKPKNSDEYEVLHADSTLSFSDFPIESTVILNGDYYHDPSLPDSVPTYQYTAVKADYTFPKEIEYEILDKLYIPEEDAVFNYGNGGTDDCFVLKLLNQAYLQTGNTDDIIEESECLSGTTARRFRPGGRIRVFDTRLQQWIGMEGVRVQARRWFTVLQANTDFNGNFRMNHSVSKVCNYSIWFAQTRFAVRHNIVNTTFWVNGPKLSGDWNYDLNNGYQRFAGHVFRAGYRYNYKDIRGLQRPLRWAAGPLFTRKRTVYVAVDNTGSSSGTNWIIVPILKIWRYRDSNTEYMSDEVFSTTSHETGHTSHVIRMNTVLQYWQVSPELQESWATAIEWYLTNIEYSERGIVNYGREDYFPVLPPVKPNSYAYQYWTKKHSEKYTSIYIDIVDNVNQLGVSYPERGFGGVDDRVTGFTLPEIEVKMLKHIYGLSSLAQLLKDNKPAGVTDEQIDLLISHF
ncbi:MAG TPA: hypothetical protein PKL56_13950 [Cyclobacteriaceae bacterium]|nr:hypothetical protein [Cyclobacteriaceae bacterium]HMV07608.1 hypothetical protein [Cyclobacteriaceae bacterium]HMV89337.1 hypothetical protein [Cyclobacteriaceae bacterium]HMW98743.1 hypothetical protein [Cyclobacteriaceae bacterium]HMX48624.1 hypothetical protein [Cyclobacteriaceae bacterium]